MGMTIEDCISKLIEILEEATEDENAVCYVTDIDESTLKMAIDTMRKYQKLQADYENRLKADLVAMLTDIQLEIEEIKPLEPTDDEDWQYGCFHGLELMQDKCLKLIQQKINSLKEA